MASKNTKLLDFMLLIGKLKTTKRTGWVRRDVHEPESVSDHMYRMATLSFLIDSNMGLDRDRCIKMAIVHDMAECIVGDIAPSDGISKDEKQRRETEAMGVLTGLVGSEASSEINGLWHEYENQESAESNFVKDLDRFEMILQAHEYETNQTIPGTLQEFFDSTEGKFKHPTIKEWVKVLYERRKVKDSSGASAD